MRKKIEACDALIEKIKNHQKEMRKTLEAERALGDLWVSGYNRGIQNGLEAAINIIKNFKEGEYRRLTDALLKKAKRGK